MPTLTGFIAWIRAVMEIGTNVLPDYSSSIATAYNIAIAIVNLDLQSIDQFIYEQAVYNLGGDTLLNYAQDQTAAIAGLTWSGGVATATTSVPHGFLTADPVSIRGVNPLGYNVAPPSAPPSVQITVTGASTFTYPIVTNPGAYVSGGVAAETYFKTIRAALGIGSFIGGTISASSDATTSESLLTPDFLKSLTMGNLQNLKTPYGRAYMALAQDYGPLWGLS